MKRILAALAIILILAGCAPEQPSHQTTIHQWQSVVDQG